MTVTPRHRIDSAAWDACVAASAQRVVYGFSWYLDAVLPGPDWTWVGVVQVGRNGNYAAVMPVPLRRKWGVWRVHQPFFCQLLGLFSRDPVLDAAPFYRLVYQRFRYGSVWQLGQWPSPNVPFVVRQRHTHVLDLSAAYPAIEARYTPDRRRNLRRARDVGWQIDDATDIEPLIALFRKNHADTIDGGVSSGAYAILRNLDAALLQRGLATVYYALLNGQMEAGALFVRDGNRIIYLFNAATETGRRGNARTLLIDRHICENAGQSSLTGPVLFDFESPEKPSIQAFYASFGATAQPFWSVRWNRLSMPERGVVWLLNQL